MTVVASPAGVAGRRAIDPAALSIQLGIVVSALLVVAILGVGFAHQPLLSLAALLGVSVFVVVAVKPVVAAWLFLAITPLVGGFERGSIVPMLRPSEALLGLVLAAVATRILFEGLRGSLPRFALTRLDVSILAMAVLSSVVPALWRVARGFSLETDDVLYATTLWKYFLVYALFRIVVRNERDIHNCLLAMVGTGVVVAVVAVLQALKIGGVPELIATVYGEPLRAVTNNRGTSTLGNSHGVADVMAIDLAICVGYLVKRHPARILFIPLAWLFGLGTIASGQFSAVFALATVVVVLGWATGRMGRTLAVALPAMLTSFLLLRPVLDARFASTDESGVPTSWEARMMNLQNYFWPELVRGHNYVLGVRPAGRLPSFEPWREFVFIESGHTWLLWTGGIPFLVAYAWFTVIAWRAAAPLTGRSGVIGVLGVAATAALGVITVLMSFDVHLTMRGAADALFPLLALLTVAHAGRKVVT